MELKYGHWELELDTKVIASAFPLIHCASPFNHNHRALTALFAATVRWITRMKWKTVMLLCCQSQSLTARIARCFPQVCNYDNYAATLGKSAQLLQIQLGKKFSLFRIACVKLASTCLSSQSSVSSLNRKLQRLRILHVTHDDCRNR